jgi:RsiW-degrading membrane proteinase PrsW (M82 family)
MSKGFYSSNQPQGQLSQLATTHDLVAYRWKILLAVMFGNTAISLLVNALKWVPSDNNTIQMLVEQALNLAFSYALIYIFIKRLMIKRYAIKWGVICIVIFSSLYIYGLIDLYNTPHSNNLSFSTEPLKFLIMMYEQVIGDLIFIFLIIETIGAVLRLRHLQEQLWGQRDTLFAGYSDADLEALGLHKASQLKSSFFSSCFTSHGLDEAEQLLIVGTSTTTPPLSLDMALIPKPWLFSWILIRCLVIYTALLLCWYRYHNELLLPGIIIIGSFAIPFSFLMLFFELNTPRNISFIKIIHLTLIGGVLSIMVSLIIYEFIPVFAPGVAMLGQSNAGIVEEIGKLAGLFIIMHFMRDLAFKYRLNALLIGAAVGAGFAAFESAGYAMSIFLHPDSANKAQFATQDMLSNIYLRGLLSPFTHVAWAAITASAYWQATKVKRSMFDALASTDFLMYFSLAVLLHMVWDFSLGNGFADLFKIIGLCYAAYFFTTKLIRKSFDELKVELEPLDPSYYQRQL